MLVFYSLITKFLNYWLVIQALSHCMDIAYFTDWKVRLVKAMVFPVDMYGCELDYKESWEPKNWSVWTVVLEKTLESPLDCKEIQPIHPKRDQSWIFIGRTDAEAETPILWPPDAKNWLTGKDPDAGKDWRPDVQQSMGLQKVRLDWATELNQTDGKFVETLVLNKFISTIFPTAFAHSMSLCHVFLYS